jgi:cytochrome P450
MPGGLLRSFQRDTPGFLLGLRDTYGDAASFFLGGELFIALFSPAMVHEVTVAQQSSFIKGVGFARMRKVLGEGLLTNEEPLHLRHRRMMQPPFHKSHLDDYAVLMNALTAEQLQEWPDAGVIALAPDMMRLTLRIVAQTLFGTDADRHAARIAHSMGIAIDRIERTMLPGLDRLDAAPIPYFQAFGTAADDLAAVAEELIVERRAAGDDSSEDLLGLLLAIRDEDGSRFTDEEVRDEALTLILSGHETTANALTWAFSWLSTRPDVQDALAAEAAATEWISAGRPPTFAEAAAAPVASQVIHESLRMAPPVWVAPRRALTDLDVAGVRVPQGAHVLISQYVTQRDPKYFPDPHAWEPSRWTEDFVKGLPRGAYFPFGAGTRKCLGDQFALLEARIILLQVMHAFHFEPIDPLHPMPRPEPRATYRAHGRVPIRVRRRS